MTVEGTADASDRVEDTVDYGEAARRVQALAQTRQVLTLERLAADIAEEILSKYAQVRRVRVRAAKPLPPAPFVAAEAGSS